MLYPIVNLRTIFEERSGQPQFHTASEDYVRIENFNFQKGEVFGPYTYEGNVIVTVLQGRIRLNFNEESQIMSDLCQGVLSTKEKFEIISEFGDACVQIIWSPTFAMTEKVE